MTTSKTKITYATLSADNEELHTSFEAAIARTRAELGHTFPMFIAGQERYAAQTFADITPIDTHVQLGYFQKGGRQDALDAIAAARSVARDWSRRPWRERVDILRRVVDLMDERMYDIAAIISLEVGKNRLEALGEFCQAMDMIRFACDEFEKQDGYRRPLLQESPKHRNFSVLKPHGVWVVISPFNAPAALTAGPAGAALVAGNTIVIKPATDTPWTVWKLAECFRDAGVPDGVVNFVTGPGDTLGEALITSEDVDGFTFTGSHDVGMRLLRTVAQGRFPRPVLVEMGGKNPVIISRHADLDKASLGCLRSAFGMQGQKCSAASRIYVERPVYDAFMHRFLQQTEAIKVGDPTQRNVFMGPVINRRAYEDYQSYVNAARQAGEIVVGGRMLTEGKLADGFFVAPTIVADLPQDNLLWKTEMFLPITVVHAVDSLDEAMILANDHTYGLTAGLFSEDPSEHAWFFDNIEIGVSYVNRAGGATTGAWPGYQAFGGWRGSGSTGKGTGSFYYLPLYMREQSQTEVG